MRRTVAAMKPEAQPRARQDSRHAKDAAGRTPPEGDRANPESPHDGFSGLPPDTGKANTPDDG